MVRRKPDHIAAAPSQARASWNGRGRGYQTRPRLPTAPEQGASVGAVKGVGEWPPLPTTEGEAVGRQRDEQARLSECSLRSPATVADGRDGRRTRRPCPPTTSACVGW